MDFFNQTSSSFAKNIHSIIALTICLFIHSVSSWQQIRYTSQTTDEWRDNFKMEHGPHGRSGHTLVLYQTDKLILFGGRGNDVQRRHLPSTFDVVDSNGILEFSTYDSKPIRDARLLIDTVHPGVCNVQESCVSFANATSSGNTQACTQSWTHAHKHNISKIERDQWEESCGFAPVVLHYNDVWMFDISQPTPTWVVLHPGATHGTCQQPLTIHSRRCKAPSERWRHGSAMLDAHTMAVYGGNSQECGDYCDDLWAFDFRTNQWSELISRSGREGVDWRSTNATIDEGTGPGVRWRFTMLGGFLDPVFHRPALIIFGGHRSWDRKIKKAQPFQTSGYLNDMWMYIKSQDYDSSERNSSLGKWIQLKKNGAFWPQSRAGYAAAYDKKRHGIWMHGGYSAYYPYGPFNMNSVAYLLGDSANETTKQAFMQKLVPFYTHPYFLEDLWFYDILRGTWKQQKPVSARKPSGRTVHTMVVSGDSLLLFGGYNINYHYNDTWHYFINDNRWLERITFENASYPDECTDDIKAVENSKSCVLLTKPQVSYQISKRNDEGSTHSLQFGIVDDAENLVRHLQKKYLENIVLDEHGDRIWLASDLPIGASIPPDAATGPRQYAQLKQLPYNTTFNISVWERCTSVFGEPTRGTLIDGLYGRSKAEIFIPQPRRRSPGWDGCRELTWVGPLERSDHAAIFVEASSKIFFYGGIGYIQTLKSLKVDITPETGVLDDFWVMNLKGCLDNCSNHGVCTDGFCKCDPGYYGINCSNETCPGSVCYYDSDFVQHCKHCCQSGYNFSDEDVYVTGVTKYPCKRTLNGDFTGTSHGICDGFGSCMCAPPFIGDDCSIKDCKNNCSLNGYCSIEFPVSRCICRDGYFGDFCQYRECLNNCSYPNGVCNDDSGVCMCQPIFSPYNSQQIYVYWEGEDCSYLTAWFSACTSKPMPWCFLVAAFFVAAVFCV